MRLPDTRLRLAYFGTPELARTILQAILDADQDDVVLVVCQPDRPRGRGKVLESPPVKQLAEARGIPVVQPLKMRDGALTERLKSDRVELAIVAAFGRILPQDMLDAPLHGCWNVHASLLPQYRGASPIQHALLHGDAETGVTLMQMSAGLDEGPMLRVERLDIAGDDTTQTLGDKLAVLGGRITLDGIAEAKRGGLAVTPQDDAAATFAPLIAKEAGRLDLTQPAVALERRIRALDPWPGTWVTLAGGDQLKVLAARVAPSAADVPPGELIALGASIDVQTGDAALQITLVQPAGKRPMSAADFLRGTGRTLAVGQRLTSDR